MPLATAFWCQCAAELKLTHDEDHLLAMVQIATGWAPDLNTPVRFGPDTQINPNP